MDALKIERVASSHSQKTMKKILVENIKTAIIVSDICGALLIIFDSLSSIESEIKSCQIGD